MCGLVSQGGGAVAAWLKEQKSILPAWRLQGHVACGRAHLRPFLLSGSFPVVSPIIGQGLRLQSVSVFMWPAVLRVCLGLDVQISLLSWGHL